MSEHADKVLAKAALDKIKFGGAPSARESNALKRVSKEQDDARRWAHYRSVPAKHYKELSGRSARVLIDQAARLGIPVSGKIVDLQAVLRGFHDYVAKHSRVSAELEELGVGGSSGSKALERYRASMAESKEMELAVARNEMAPMAEVVELVGMCCARLTRCMSVLENSMAAEVSVWLVSPEVRAMSTEDRQRMVREYVVKMCRDVRRQEAADVRSMLAAMRSESADGSSVEAVLADADGRIADASPM